MASDEDLKLSDTLRYYMRDSNAAKNLLYRRRRCLANYETANKNLDKARAKNREVGAVSAKKYVIYFYLGNNNTLSIRYSYDCLGSYKLVQFKRGL